jgi:hypothetical protein
VPSQLESLLALGAKLRQERPHDGGETLTMRMAARWLRVRGRNGEMEPLIANPAQRAFEARCTDHNIVLKARQMGMTTWIAARLFLRTITRPGVLTVQVAHTREAAESIFAVAQRLWANLPRPLREGPLRRSRANVGQMVFAALDSEFRVVSAADENAGRGMTIQHLHLSEVSRWPNDAAATLAGLRAALAPGGEMTLESTPSGAHGCFYDEWRRAQESGLTRHFFPWWLEPAYIAAPATDLTAEEQALASAHGLSPAQIGFRRGLARSFGTLRAQEFAEDAVSCFRASGACCFDVEAIERRLAQLAETALEVRRGGTLQVWFPPLPGKDYLVAVDAAGGGSEGDFAAAQVIELATGLQCAELRERLAPAELARESARLAREYGGALLAIERNNHGAAVLAYLDQAERYARVYAQEGVAGWLTSAGSKPAMIGRMGVLLTESPEIFRSRRLLEECRTFVTRANGSSGAASGAHDDCLMAMAVAQGVRASVLPDEPAARGAVTS